MVRILNPHDCRLDVGMLLEPGPDQVTVMGPGVLGGARRVHADQTAAPGHEGGQRIPFGGRQDVPAGVEKDDRGETRQIPRAQDRCVLGRATVSPICSPSSVSALIPAGIESCRKPAVVVRTRMSTGLLPFKFAVTL